MINNSSLHKWDRLRQKQFDTQFINQLQAGMNCSMFEVRPSSMLFMRSTSHFLTTVQACGPDRSVSSVNK
ncbi:MAG: hypothetical protein LBL79_09140 [Prevotella sp.]|nr:hypothetical protein [Prevotella sp.]